MYSMYWALCSHLVKDGEFALHFSIQLIRETNGLLCVSFSGLETLLPKSIISDRCYKLIVNQN